jgi:hypothetical protein
VGDVPRPIRRGMVPVVERLRINHYWSGSLEDLATKNRAR